MLDLYHYIFIILKTILTIILVDAGEKMGLQITVLLADVIYVDILQSTVPIFDSLGNTPLILMFFAVSITLLCICLLLTTHTLFLYHCPEYEARNFSRTEARISRGIAKVTFLKTPFMKTKTHL